MAHDNQMIPSPSKMPACPTMNGTRTNKYDAHDVLERRHEDALTVPSFVAGGAAASWRRDSASKTMLSTSVLRTRGVASIFRSLSMYNGAALGGAAMVLRPLPDWLRWCSARRRREARRNDCVLLSTASGTLRVWQPERGVLASKHLRTVPRPRDRPTSVRGAGARGERYHPNPSCLLASVLQAASSRCSPRSIFYAWIARAARVETLELQHLRQPSHLNVWARSLSLPSSRASAEWLAAQRSQSLATASVARATLREGESWPRRCAPPASPLLASKLSGESIEEDRSEANPTNWGPDDARIVFTAYFEGTANVVERRTTQIGLFHELDRGIDVGATRRRPRQAARTARENGRRSRPLRFKMGVDGCGHEHGLAGVVFAFGLRGQCERLAACVRAVRGVLGEPKTQLNIVGLSRGAVAALAVAEMLGATPQFCGGERELPSLNSQNSSDDGASTPPSSSGSLNILADSPLRIPDSDPRPRPSPLLMPCITLLQQ